MLLPIVSVAMLIEKRMPVLPILDLDSCDTFKLQNIILDIIDPSNNSL